MADAYLIRIDYERIGRTMIEEPPEKRTPAAIAAWLRGLGLREQPDGRWLCEEVELRLFAPEEILERRQVF